MLVLNGQRRKANPPAFCLRATQRHSLSVPESSAIKITMQIQKVLNVKTPHPEASALLFLVTQPVTTGGGVTK